jgi:hypothetical protein
VLEADEDDKARLLAFGPSDKHLPSEPLPAVDDVDLVSWVHRIPVVAPDAQLRGPHFIK